MNKNLGLRNARKAKKDEFYTRYEDIQEELNHYEEHFNNKTVLCNCDDPFESNFCKFFLRNFKYLKLKRLICTSYAFSPVVGSGTGILDDSDKPIKRGNGYVMDISEIPVKNGMGVSEDDIKQLLKSEKRGVKKLIANGDFRSDECVKYLEQADIVVTNPPFSLFREYVDQLIKYRKKFLILGKINAVAYKEFFPYLKNNEVWIGYGYNKSMIYKTPYQNTGKENRKFVMRKGYNPDDSYIVVPGICWFTNLDIKKRHEEIDLYRTYNDVDYLRYDNYSAINIDKVSEIPCDYNGFMGVPVSFMGKYNPDQFEICGLGAGDAAKKLGVKKNFRGRTDLAYTKDGVPKCPGSRIIIRRKER